MNIRVGHNTRLLLSAVAVTLVVGLAGCGSGAVPSSPEPSSNGKRTIPISAVLLPDKSEARVTAFQEAGGLSKLGAVFLALTKLEMVSTQENVYECTATFPTNTQAEINLSVTHGQKYTRTADEIALSGVQPLGVSLTHSAGDGYYRMKLQYYLPDGALSARANSEVKTGYARPLFLRDITPLQVNPAAFVGPEPGNQTGPLPQGSGDLSVTMVQLETVIIEAGKELVGAIEEVILKEGLGATDVGNPLGTAASSMLDVIGALDMSVEYGDLIAELDELQAEAENPTNPLTQKAYAEDPGWKETILTEIANARTELRWDAAVAYLNLEVSVALGLVGSPALSIAASPITSWNAETIRKLMRERIRIIQKMITTGYVNPGRETADEGSSVGSGGAVVNDGSAERTLPPGTWLASYQATREDKSGDAVWNYVDHGTFTFIVGKDFQISGEGNGSMSMRLETPNGVTRAESEYSFTVEGFAFMGQIHQLTFSQPGESMKGYSTINDKKEMLPYETSTPGPMIPKGALALKSGESLTTDERVQWPDGVLMTRKLTLTIK